MTLTEKQVYKSADELRKILDILQHEKFILDCGHRVTFNRVLGSNVIIHNGVELRIICTECGY
jgi:hypothetical protein